MGSAKGTAPRGIPRTPRPTRRTQSNTARPLPGAKGESLEDLEQPERTEQIRQDHEQRLARMRIKVQPNPLRPGSEPLDIDDLYGHIEGLSRLP